MAISIESDIVDRDGQSFRRRQYIVRSTPSTDPTVITLAAPEGVKTITEVSVQVVGTGAAGTAPFVEVYPSAGDWVANIKSGAADVAALFATISGY